MYVNGVSGNWIRQYSLDTPFDVSSVNNDLAGQICNGYIGSISTFGCMNLIFNLMVQRFKIFMVDRADETIMRTI